MTREEAVEVAATVVCGATAVFGAFVRRRRERREVEQSDSPIREAMIRRFAKWCAKNSQNNYVNKII